MMDDSQRMFDRAAHFASPGGQLPAGFSVSQALIYNHANLLSRSPKKDQQKQAVAEFERYLRAASPASAWWDVAYAQYTQLCRALHLSPAEKERFKPTETGQYRYLASVSFDADHEVALADPIAEVRKRLGDGAVVPTIPGTNLATYRYPQYDTDLLAAETVLAICLRGDHAPGLPVREAAPSAIARTLRLNMPVEELNQILGNEYDFRQLTDPSVDYRFYRHLGLAVRVLKGRVKELVVAQIPERQMLDTH